MKKHHVLLIATLATLGLTACDSGNSPEEGAVSGVEDTTMSDANSDAMTNSIENAADDAINIIEDTVDEASNDVDQLMEDMTSDTESDLSDAMGKMEK
jgi:hypothetical protein